VDLVIDDNENLLTVTCQSIQGPNVAYYAFFLDGEYIASRDSEESPTLTIDKTRYSRGTHYLRAVIKTADGNEYLTADQNVLFNSPLYDVGFSELFNPSKKFPITGKLDAGYSATIAIKDIDGQTLWSNTYTDDFIATVDSNKFSEGGVSYKVSYSYAPTVFKSFSQNSLFTKPMLSSSGFASGEFSILALDGPPSYAAAGLILCMMEDGMKEGTNELDTGTCRFTYQMWEGTGVKPILLLGYGTNNQVRHGMLNRVFRKYKNIKYAHFYAHGNYLVGPYGFRVRRTALLFNDGVWVAFNSRKWTDKGLSVPSGYEWLSANLEKAHYFNELPFAEGQLRFVVLESCYALRNVVTIDGDGLPHYENWVYDYELANHINAHPDYPYSDMCSGLNVITNAQMILGGGDVIIKGGMYPYYSRFFNVFWRELTNGYTAKEALDEAILIATDDVMRYYRWRGAADIYYLKF
ncbi:MAG: hypothetical protein WCE45_02305, partial [Sedimentisphaerales bacterium]